MSKQPITKSVLIGRIAQAHHLPRKTANAILATIMDLAFQRAKDVFTAKSHWADALSNHAAHTHAAAHRAHIRRHYSAA